MNYGYNLDGDLFGITARIREIDPDYFIRFNCVRRVYEVHSRKVGLFAPTLQLVLPYDRLDERAVMFTARTRRERAYEYLREIEAENRERERRLTVAAAKKAERGAERLLTGGRYDIIRDCRAGGITAALGRRRGRNGGA